MSDPEPSRAAQEALARDLAARRLATQARTRSQLAAEMHQRGIADDVAASVLDRFTSVGLIDDAAYARDWVRSRGEGKQLSRQRLSQELRSRGVAPTEIEEAVGELGEDEERAHAQRLVARRLSVTSNLPRATRQRRLVALLLRHGYSPGLSARVVIAALDAEPRG